MEDSVTSSDVPEMPLARGGGARRPPEVWTGGAAGAAGRAGPRGRVGTRVGRPRRALAEAREGEIAYRIETRGRAESGDVGRLMELGGLQATESIESAGEEGGEGAVARGSDAAGGGADIGERGTWAIGGACTTVESCDAGGACATRGEA